jgi:hypothetical protein
LERLAGNTVPPAEADWIPYSHFPSIACQAFTYRRRGSCLMILPLRICVEFHNRW